MGKYLYVGDQVMNAAILDELIHLYEENIDTLYGSDSETIIPILLPASMLPQRTFRS